MYDLNFHVLIEAWPFILKGIGITVLVSAVSSLFAFLIGVLVSFLRNTKNIALKFLSASWVEFVRNTPLLIQIYFLYKALPAVGINFSAMVCGILALSLYTGAYIAEVFRSGINAIASEQVEAAKGLGLNSFQIFKIILFPQALRIVIPPLGSQFINLIKNSSLVSFIAVTDIFYVIYKGAADDFRIVEYFILGIVVYMTLTGFVVYITKLLEEKLRIPDSEAKI